METISRCVKNESHSMFVEYALLAILVSVTVVLRVTMQA